MGGRRHHEVAGLAVRSGHRTIPIFQSTLFSGGVSDGPKPAITMVLVKTATSFYVLRFLLGSFRHLSGAR
jgi:hypothetical protein